MGLPRGSTTRPKRAFPAGTSAMRPVMHRVAFLDLLGLAQEHGADDVALEVEGDAVHAVGELEQSPAMAFLRP
jgi:hypothetical protein